MGRVWQLNLDEEQVLFLVALLAMFNYALEQDIVNCQRGLLSAESFALEMGDERYRGLWTQLALLAKSTPQYEEFEAAVSGGDISLEDWP